MIDATLNKINKIVPSKWQWVLNHEGFRRYFKNTGWMFAGQMFSLLISFFVGAWLARYLGPENYGVFNYAISFAGLFGFIAPLGVDAILSRDLVVHPEKRDELMGTAFGLKLIGGIIAFLSASLAAYFLETSYLIKIIVVIFSFNFVLSSFNIISTFFSSNVESKKNVKVLFFSSLIAAILKIALITFRVGIIWLSVILLLEFAIQSIGFISSYKKDNLLIKKWRFNKVLAGSILKKSWFLMLASAAAFIYLKIDQVMIGKMMSATDVGLYAAAVKLADIWYFIPGIICASLFPAIINAKKISDKIYRNRLNNLYWFMFVASILIALPITLFSRSLISFIFGFQYIGASSILQIYVWAGVGMFLGIAVNQYLLSENMMKTIFVLSFLTMTVNVMLNLILIPYLGLNGAALATLVSYLITPLFVFTFGNFLKNRII